MTFAALVSISALLSGEVVALGRATRVMVTGQGKIRITGEERADLTYDSPSEVVLRTEGEWLKIYVKSEAGIELRCPKGLAAVAIENPAGEAEAVDLNGEVFIRAAGRIWLDRLGGSAMVRSPGGEVRAGRIAGSLRCFSGGGPIRIDSVGMAQIESRGGEIIIGDARGPVTAHSLGGNIQIERAASTVEASTTGGSIQIGSARGVNCRAGAGGIRLKNVSGVVRAETGSGTILMEPSRISPLGETFLRTSSGDIVVLLPSKLALTVKAEAHEGGRTARIVSGFPEIPVWGLAGEGSLNGGGPLMRLDVTDGTIFLRRATPRP
ncbi:MAG: DUF4097 family beta strand repeat-containing protein [Acidobacteria bacterium]|nr:DUF4097 family beta strand repeat-containing protein [Acidobacteriota bacterium]